MTGEYGSAGTAGDGYLVPDQPHRWEPHDSDWGFRPVCRRCGQPLHHDNHRALNLPAAAAS